MKHKVIMRLKIKGTLNSIEQELKYLFSYTLGSIIRQTSEEYCCIVQYPSEAEEVLNQTKQKYPHIANKIIFTTSIRDEIKALLEGSSLLGYEDIWFMSMGIKQVYPLNMIEQFNHYIPDNRTKILLIQEGYVYAIDEKRLYQVKANNSNAYIYVCRIDEYKKHFIVYDYYYPAILEEKYHLLKNEALREKMLVIRQCISSKQLQDLAELEGKEKDKVLANFKWSEV